MAGIKGASGAPNIKKNYKTGPAAQGLTSKIYKLSEDDISIITSASGSNQTDKLRTILKEWNEMKKKGI